MPPAGPRKHRIALQASILEPDEAGQPIPTWSTYASRWARIEPLSGRELERAREIQPDVTHRLTLPAAGLTGALRVTPEHQVLFGSREFAIRSALYEEESTDKLVLLATERV